MKMKMTKCGAICAGLAAVISLIGCTSQNGGGVPELREKRPLTSFSQEITSPVHDIQIKRGTVYTLNLTCKNTGTEPWIRGAGPMFVDAGYRWKDSKGSQLPFEGTRAQLTRSVVRPGESDFLKLQIIAQPNPGSYTLWISMVQEQVA
jgi:hypothetical protein